MTAVANSFFTELMCEWFFMSSVVVPMVFHIEQNDMYQRWSDNVIIKIIKNFVSLVCEDELLLSARPGLKNSHESFCSLLRVFTV